jgi:hypothetical protein
MLVVNKTCNQPFALRNIFPGLVIKKVNRTGPVGTTEGVKLAFAGHFYEIFFTLCRRLPGVLKEAGARGQH